MAPARTPAEVRAGHGLAYGVTAYLLWGLFPLFWPLLSPSGSVEILAHRILWSLIVVAVLLGARRQWGWLRLLGRRRAGLLAVAAVVIAVNWGTYIHGVTSGQVVETSLGYFINPLVTVLLGVLVLGEQLRRAQWAAVAVAAVAVLVLSVDYGRPPLIALTLAFSFGAYALLKKKAGVGAVESLTVETLVLAPVALGYLLVLAARGDATFLAEGSGHALLLVASGIVTAVPLLCFGAAAIRVPLSTLGLLQYLAPVIQFLIGVALLHEVMPASRWVGFALVWLALVVLSADAVRHAGSRRRGRRADPAPLA